MNKKIIIIDDKDHALKQIKYNFPEDKINDYDFHHFNSFRDF